MSSLNSIRDTFFEECEELLEALAEGLAAMDGGSRDAETINAVFRAVHSIKGGAGAFGLSSLVSFAHQFETVLDGVRSQTVVLTPEVMHVLLRSADHLADQVEAARDGVDIDPEATKGFLSALNGCLGEDDDLSMSSPDEPFEFAAVTLDFGAPVDVPTEDGAEAPASSEGEAILVSFRPKAALYDNGHDPALLLNSLADLGAISVKLDLSGLQDLDKHDPRQPNLHWQITVQTSEGETVIHEIFDFVQGLCDLDVRPLSQAGGAPASPAPASPPPVAAAPPRPAAPAPVVAAAPPAPKPAAEAPKPEIPAKPVEAAAPAPARSAPANDASDGEAKGPKPTLRVDLERVDRLINSVGELIINQAMIAQRFQNMSLASDDEVVAHVEDYRLLARDIQEAVMAIRAQPVKPLFQRMSRIVREAADATGKQAVLVTGGETTEVDKTVIERLADPLTHMIRNAVDHGLEKPEDRAAIGKERTGTIRLSAAHRSGAVMITIRDDGAGLNRKKVLEVARRKGLVDANAELSDSEIDGLIFLPGFSTASQISNLSGRGVGLDVVKNAVTALGGRISIASFPGEGTEFTISLPLTLAVMDGMVVSVAGQTMVVPLSSVLETIRPAASDLHRIGTDEALLSIRGKFIPMVDVAKSLGFDNGPERNASPLLLLVEAENQTQCALIVDAVYDQRQVVIKGLESNYGSVRGVSAATVLGDGQIALILDPDAIAIQRQGGFQAARTIS